MTGSAYVAQRFMVILNLYARNVCHSVQRVPERRLWMSAPRIPWALETFGPQVSKL